MCEQKKNPFPMDLALAQGSKEFDCMVGNYPSSMREGVKWGTEREKKGKENSTWLAS